MRIRSPTLLSFFVRCGEAPPNAAFAHPLIRSLRRVQLHWPAALALRLIAALAGELFVFHFLHTTEYRLADVFMRRHAADIAPDLDYLPEPPAANKQRMEGN
jgi:hypothetical protein